MLSIEKLIKQYGTSVYKLEKFRRSMDLSDPLSAEEDKTISGMISDMRFAMEWLRTGRSPGRRKGIEQTQVYLKNELQKELDGKELTQLEIKRLVRQILSLSSRERQCFLLHYAHGLTYSEISESLKLSRGSVQKFVERAREKMKDPHD